MIKGKETKAYEENAKRRAKFRKNGGKHRRRTKAEVIADAQAVTLKEQADAGLHVYTAVSPITGKRCSHRPFRSKLWLKRHMDGGRHVFAAGCARDQRIRLGMNYLNALERPLSSEAESTTAETEEGAADAQGANKPEDHWFPPLRDVP